MKAWFYAVVVLQVAFLLGQAATAQIGLSRGQVVTLKVVPVDPRSLFMGRYMALAYDISTIDLSSVEHAEPMEVFEPDCTVYVELIPQEPWAAATGVARTRSAARANRVYLRGRIVGWYGSTIRVEYGLERYFIPETKQQEVGQLQWGRRARPLEVTVEVSVQKSGQGLIRRVLVEGEPLGF